MTTDDSSARPGAPLLSPPAGGFYSLPHRRWFVIATCAAVCLGVFYLAEPMWHQTWDDAAITLGYGRTLAENGTITFGRYGERVEGFSSFLWMLVAAGLARFARTPEELLQAAKLTCVVLYVCNGALCHRLMRRMGGSDWPALIAAWLFYGASMSMTAFIDGMENHLFAALFLGVALLYLNLRERGSAWVAAGLCIALVALLLCRPEGVFGLAAVAGALLVERRGFEPRAWRRAWGCVLVAAVLYGGFLCWRHWYFGAWPPNSVYAKMHAPYTASFWMRLSGGATYSGKFLLILCGWTVFAIGGQCGWRELVRAVRGGIAAQALLTLTVALFLVFHLATGAPWGTVNRTYVGVVPYVLVLVLYLLTRLRLRLPYWRVALCAVPWLIGHYWAYLAYASDAAPVGRIRADYASAMRLALTLADPPTVALPDTGATLLWWGQRVRLIDTALLNNTRAAREGWGAIQDTVFAKGSPDLIATHDVWTVLSGLGRAPRVQREYELIVIDGRFFLLRRDHVGTLVARPPPGVRVRPVTTVTPEEELAYRRAYAQDPLSGTALIDVPWNWVIELSPEYVPQ